MRIAIVCQYFPPEVAPIGIMVKELGCALADSGHSVTIVSGNPNHPTGLLFEGYTNSLSGTTTQLSERLELRRSWLYISKSKRFLPRVLNYLSFLASSTFFLARNRYDCLLIISPPLTNMVTGLALRSLGRRYVLNVQDVFPDAAVTAGIIKNQYLIRLLKCVERLGYRFAERVVVISEGFRTNLYSKEVKSSKVVVIPNWIDTDEIAPRPKCNSFSQMHGIEKAFVVLYSGTIGIVSGAEVIAAVSQSLRIQSSVHFLVIGEGTAKISLQKKVVDLHLPNFLFLPFQPREHLSETLSAASLGLVTLRKGCGRHSVPSKILGYMAAGLPVVASVDPDSDTWAFVAETQCGICVPPEDPFAIAQAIEKLANDPNMCTIFGQNGRRYLERNLSRGSVCDKYCHLFDELAQEICPQKSNYNSFTVEAENKGKSS